MSPRQRLLRLLRRWHARIGLAAALFFLVLSATGLALNHGSALGLDATYVHAAWLARWYGLRPAAPRALFQSPSHTLSAANGRWLLDGRAMGEARANPVGMVELPGMLAIASDAELYLVDRSGTLIERLDRTALPITPVRAIGSNGASLVLRGAKDTFASEDAVSWRHADIANVSWSKPTPLSVAQRETYAALLVPGVSLQRLLADLHSGRIAGPIGPSVVDALGVLLAVLALSGGWLFLRASHRH